MKNNKIVVDLNKVQFGSIHYVNQEGSISLLKPSDGTVHGRFVLPNQTAAYHPDYPGETMYERACRLDLWDRWIAVVVFQLSANHTLTYTGEKALSMWKAWNSKIFKKDK